MKKPISWFEIPANDFQRAVQFYKKVLNVNIQVCGHETEKIGCFPDDG